MPTSRRVRLLLAAGALALAPSVARAQEVHAWTLCLPGAFHSCHSLQLGTTAVYSGSTRVGTDVTVSLHNLNGQIAADNTAWSGLEQVHIGNPDLFPPQGDEHQAGLLTLSGGASGDASWVVQWKGWIVQTYALGPGGLLGGCASGTGTGIYSAVATSAYTCGPDASASLSFTTSMLFDASAYNGVALWAFGQLPGDEGTNGGSCSMGSFYGWHPDACQVLSESITTTPEPATLTLVVSGLLGIGGAALRRRRG